MRCCSGFTLIELMVVVAITGILATVSIPQYHNYIQRSEIVEALGMAGHIRENITQYYLENLTFPASNREAGVPEAEYLIGNRITRVVVEAGAIHITLGNKVSKPLRGKVLSFRPAVVTGSPTSPIAWLCGFSDAVTGMEARGENKTSLGISSLPSECRR
ncbi:Type IV pilus biogenesis protein PilE [hydrothermal vent metagenome]|uniref:Type IV pilus biogenesis protein PilE n=1 Tax=hydrothermal vent metagenome TaxID=652676 RepID=A0A3B0Y2T5_9ZZZZ